ncbi:SMI1/KNR4 family protein [Gracilibacillus kekensis]|uniref:SMI1-KNR4 cell-wall n=1 Tax=Gracilibacillus kekensis TaxID=1027249 RepID=A0A1M7KJW7_9BACI|nr:SMI1/KNR4 family protein [Gracilibacillus kekensis]SHM65570.1 SMI1-KNR4 cell-wall [Gracilibacillus kekensis]
MNYKEFLLTVNEARNKRPIWFGLESEPKCNDNHIEKVERVLSLSLPDEYKIFVKELGGGYFAFTNIFSVNDIGDWYIVNLNNQIGLLETHSFLAVSDTEAGDYYGFTIEKGVCSSRVMFYNHEINKVEETKYENLYDYILDVGLNPR